MIQIIIWFAAFLCPDPTHTVTNHGNCTLVHMSPTTSFGEDEGDGGLDDGGDTGGELGGHPHPHPTPPPPPPAP